LSSSPAQFDPGPRRGAFARLLVALLGASALALGVSGCEYFTSERLSKLAPGGEKPPAVATTPAAGGASEEDEAARLSAAEVVAMLERIIRGNQRELDDLAPRVEDQDEMEEARDVFQHLDDLKQSLDRERKKAREADDDARYAEIDRQAGALEKPWNLARGRLDLDLRGRTLVRERIEILRDVVAHDRRRLDSILATGELTRVLNEKPPEPAPAVDRPAASVPTAEAEKPDDAPPAAAIPLVPGPPTAAPKQEEARPDAEKKDDAKPAEAPKADEAGTETPKDAAAADAEKKPVPPPSKELVVAKKTLEAKSTAVQRLQERSITLDARMKSLERSLQLLKDLADVARRSAENATETGDYLQEQLADEKPSAAVQAWTHDGADALGSLSRRARAAGEDEKRIRARLGDMVEERELVVDALRQTVVHAQSAREGLEQTQETVEALQSPLSSHNIRRWFRDNAPPIVATLVVMSLLYLLVTRYSHRLVKFFAARGIRGSKAERDNRMETLVSVLQNTGGALVLLVGGATLLSQVGIPVGPLLGGAAVAGVAVAFGAQNLIKDFFYGFMILLENQYKLKDVVKIGDHSGQVEQITLRMTALRDGDGGLHFLPNGSTTSVVNLTHGWSSATFAARIAWEEDVDRVIAIIAELGKELRQDPKFRLMIVDDLDVWGVDSISGRAVEIRFAIKTLPLQQWAVKRELLKRLKKKFQEKDVLLPPLVLAATEPPK